MAGKTFHLTCTSKFGFPIKVYHNGKHIGEIPKDAIDYKGLNPFTVSSGDGKRYSFKIKMKREDGKIFPDDCSYCCSPDCGCSLSGDRKTVDCSWSIPTTGTLSEDTEVTVTVGDTQPC